MQARSGADVWCPLAAPDVSVADMQTYVRQECGLAILSAHAASQAGSTEQSPEQRRERDKLLRRAFLVVGESKRKDMPADAPLHVCMVPDRGELKKQVSITPFCKLRTRQCELQTSTRVPRLYMCRLRQH